MRKLFILGILALVVTAIVGCGNGGGDSQWSKPAWATEGVYPVAAYGENGDLIGYVTGMDPVNVWVTIYNPTMDKFFEITPEGGRIKGYRKNTIMADDNCNLYLYHKQGNFIYSNMDVDYPPIGDTDFSTFSMDRSIGIPIDEIATIPQKIWDDNTQLYYYECDFNIIYGAQKYWNTHWPGMLFSPVIPYTEPLPFVHPAGELTFSMD